MRPKVGNFEKEPFHHICDLQKKDILKMVMSDQESFLFKLLKGMCWAI
jgi:hypothetical protein